LGLLGPRSFSVKSNSTKEKKKKKTKKEPHKKIKKKKKMSIVGLCVDYAATGLGHTDRAPSRVCLARDGAIVYDSLIAVPTLEDAMEEYTQIKESDLRAATTTLAEASETVCAILSPTDVLVGASTARAVRALGLVHGAHFNRIVDLVERTRTWNRRFGHWNYYSLQKIAYVCGITERPKNARERADAAARVYHALSTRILVSDVKMQLQAKQYARQFPPEIAAKPEASCRVCTHAYNAELCFCGQPTLSDRRAIAEPPRTEAS
jgi:hypothetical protein